MPITKRFHGALKFYLIGAFATLLSGYDTGNIGGALLFVKQDMHLSALGEGWIVSSLIIGAIVGSVGGGRLADRVGRRPTIVVMAYLFLVGCLGEAISPSLGSLAAFRVIVGLSVGCASVVVPIYIAELAPAEARGSLTSLFQLMIVIGTLLGYGVDAALGHAEAWRWMFALGAIPAIALLLALRVVPETPRWLYRRGRADAARRVLVQLRGAGDVEPELDRMRSLAAARPPTRRSWSALRSSQNRRALVIGIGLAIFTQITGINTIIYYAPTILTTIGLGTSVALILNVGLGAWAIVAMLFEIFLIDRVGRKPLLLFGSAALCLSMLVAGLSRVIGGLGLMTAGIIAVLCFLVFETGFQVGWGAIPSIVASEVFSGDARGLGFGICNGVNWSINFIVSLTFPLLFVGGAGTPFFVYGLMALFACAFIVYLVPETNGKNLEDMEATLRQ
ncbi:MAG TPA: sugar porter family MFS transporter [Rhodanobacteraceae bacterium]